MTRFDTFLLMVIDYGINRDSFFTVLPRLNGMPRMRLDKSSIVCDETQFGKKIYNIRTGVTHVNAKQKERLEAIGFYSVRISLLQRAIMFKERERIAKGG